MPGIESNKLDRQSVRAALVIGVVAMSFLLRQILAPHFGINLPPFITFYPAVMIVAILCGFWSGLLATALSALLADYWIFLPIGPFAVANTSQAFSFAVFVGMGVSMSAAAGRYRRFQRRVAAFEREQALRETNWQLQQIADSQHSLLKNIDEGFAVCEALYDQSGASYDYRIVEVNEAYERQTGLKAEVVVGKTALQLFPDIERSWIERLGKIATTGEAERFENFNQKTGKYYETFAYSPARGKFSLLIRDVSERKWIEMALRASEERFRSVLLNMSEGLMLFDEQGNLVYQNPASLRIHGLESEEEEKELTSELLKSGWSGWDDNGCPLSPDEWPISRIARGERFQNQTLHARRVDSGYEFDGSYNGSPLYGSGGNLIGGLITIRDITNQKRAQAALIRSEKLATVGRMAATIAHEINNPLAAVANLLFLVGTTENLPEPARQHLEVVDAELKKIAHITRLSLGFYRESEAVENVSLIVVLESTLSLLKSKIKAKRAVIEKDWDGQVEIVARAGEMRQIFSNLIINALDAIDEGGTIKVRASTARSALNNGHLCVRVTIADNGTGIRASAREHIFEPFFTTKGSVGNGLGLWVTSQIVEKQSGMIRVRSSTGGAHRGTSFSVVLPVDPVATNHN